MLNLNPVYNYYSTVYQPKSQSKYDSHKRSELKNVYNAMVRMNQESPLFKVNFSEQTQQNAIGLKNAAIGLRNFSTFLSDTEENTFSKLMAQSSDLTSLEASVITNDYDSLPEQMTFSIDKLAKEQQNMGDSVVSDRLNAMPGKYSFSVIINGNNYGFHYTVKEGDNNLSVLTHLSHFLNETDIGIQSYVLQNKGNSQLVLESEHTGTDNTSDGLLFHISDNDTDGLISAYHLDNVTQYPEDAQFSINSMPQTSSSNNIAINHMVEVVLKKTTENEVNVSFLPDHENTINKMNEFVNSYNHIVDLAQEQSKDQISARKLLHEINGISNHYHSNLEAVGLNINDDGKLQTDESLLLQSVSNGNLKNLFSDLSDFKNELVRETNIISLDPMRYIDKTVVTYPNPGHTYMNPYMPSAYSGMMFNYYA